ncbi:hypothetical protein MNBD_GAMMA22-2750 [hydrothermal vent metagenome]|uniref:Uncharacterized protein n=1 Tax=hydrothermal vent metagenome TaxID=652676 RepID=A0A3B0ZVW0_9ZZZZ
MKNMKCKRFSKLLLLLVMSINVGLLQAKEIQTKLTWFNITTLSFRVNGNVNELYVQPGDYIKKNQKIINLDQREYLENVTLTKSLFKSRKSELDEARRELERATELFDRTVLSEHELQTVKNNFISSETRFVTANTNKLNAKRELEFSNIVSPFDAVVVDVKVKKSETIVSTFKAMPAVIIAQANKLSALFKLSADEKSKLKRNDVVKVVVAGASYEGKIFFPTLLPENDLYPVGVEITVSHDKIHAGMAARINF